MSAGYCDAEVPTASGLQTTPSKDVEDVNATEKCPIEQKILDVPTGARAQGGDVKPSSKDVALELAPLELVAPFLSIGDICQLVAVSHEIFNAMTIPCGEAKESVTNEVAKPVEAPAKPAEDAVEDIANLSALPDDVRAASRALPEPKNKLVVPVLSMQLMDCDRAMQLVSLPHVEVLRVFSRVAFELVKESITKGRQQKHGRNYSRLRKLTFQGTALNTDDVNGFLDNLLTRPELILVNFERNNLRDDAAAEIFQKCLPNSPTETLCSRRNHIADKCCQVLADILRMNTPLRVLNLKANRVCDECCKVLAAALPANQNLTLLNVRCQVPPITNIAAQHFALALGTNRTLLKLRLRRNKIEDKGACALAEVLTTSNTTLQELDLQANRIGTPGGMALARMLRMNHAIQEVHMALNKFDRAKLKADLVSGGKQEDEALGDDLRMIFEELPDV